METGGTAPRLSSGNSDNKFYYIKDGDSGNTAATRFISGSGDGLAVCNSKDNNFIAAGENDGYLYIVNATNRADTLFARFYEKN
mgnify:CR=1 FL=1